MTLNELSTEALDAATPELGTGPVTMLNLLWFRPEVGYSATAKSPQPDPRSALYNGSRGKLLGFFAAQPACLLAMEPARRPLLGAS